MRERLAAYIRDQSENVAVHTGKGIEFLDKYSALVRDRCNIEAEYAKNLRSLAKKYLPKKKEREAEEGEFSYDRAFCGVLSELQDVAGQHEIISETFRERVLRDIADTSRDLKEQRKKHLSEAARLQAGLDGSIDAMLKTQKAYHRAFKEAEASHYKYTKAEGNMDLSRAELKKAEQTALIKAQTQEEAKSTYAHQLQITNEAQRRHFGQDLPSILENLRLMDEGRIAYIQRLMIQCIQVEQAALPILARCLDGMRKHADAIAAPADSKTVLDRYRTGYAPRPDFAFEDYGSPQSSGDTHSLSSNGATPALARGAGPRKSAGVTRNPSRSDKQRSKSVVDKLFGTKHKQEELSEDFAQLPPSQRCKRLRDRIHHFESEIEIKTKAKDGLTKLAQCYTDQPKMGNLEEVNSSLKETNRQIDLLTQQLNKFKAYLSEAETQVSSGNGNGSARSPSTSLVSNGASSSPGKPQRSSLSEESISSESSLGARGRLSSALSSAPGSQPHSARPAGPQPGLPTGLPGGAGAPLARSDVGYADEGGSSGEYNEADEEAPDPVLGTAAVLYAFDGGNEGTMAVGEGEEVLLVEKDEGDGWTRIRKLRGPQEGFVPSSYLDCKWYPKL